MGEAPPLLLIPSPLLSHETWGPVERSLIASGYQATIVLFTGRERCWAESGRQIAAAARVFDTPPVLVAHSGAGQALPAACQAIGSVAACIFVDATIPDDGLAWLNSVPAEARESPAFRKAERTGLAPNYWREPALWERVGVEDGALRDRLAADCLNVTMDLYRDPVRVPPGWSTVPAGYLAFVPNPFYEPFEDEAFGRGWLVRRLPGSHLHMLVDPEATAAALVGLLRDLGLVSPEAAP